jgi:hypothetical protein
LGGNFALGTNVDASATSGWNACSTCNNAGAGHYGFTPIGNTTTAFTGNFDGLGLTITNLTINQYAGGSVGLFGVLGVDGSAPPLPTVRNVGLLGATVTVGSAGGGSVSFNTYAGALVGMNYGAVRNSYSTGSVNGYSANAFPYLTVGGLVGGNYGLISNSHSQANVSNDQPESSGTGGLVGGNLYLGMIAQSYATGSVTGGYGSTFVGGLVGQSNTSTILNSFATGAVSAGVNSTYTGGLAGSGSTILNSYATGSVTAGLGSYRVGGLAGEETNSISNSYATGNVQVNGAPGGGGNADLGGLVGVNYGAISNSYAVGSVTVIGSNTGPVGGLVGLLQVGSISNSYSTGNLSGVTGGSVGGLVGAVSNGGTATNSFWNTTSSEISTSALGTGLTTANMQTLASFTSPTVANGMVNPNWEFLNTWVMYEGQTSPLLRVFMTPLTVSGTLTQTYKGAAFAPSIAALTYSSTPDFTHLFGTATVSGTALGAVHAGTYSDTLSGLYSDQQGYILSFTAGTLTIGPAALTVSGTTASKVYNGTTMATLAGGTLVGVVGGDSVSLLQSGTYASKNVGNAIAVTVTDSLGGTSVSDYSLIEPVGLTGTITPAALSVSGTTVGNRAYNGTTVAALSGGALLGVIGGDSVTLGQAGTFASKNVGTGIAVNAADSLGGANAGDYVLVEPTTLTGNITSAMLTVGGTAVGSKVYNGTTAASLTDGSLLGVIGDDAVTLTQAGTFGSKNAGSGIAVTATDGLSGASAGNYLLVEPIHLAGDITPASLTVIDTRVGHKVYDGTTVAILNGGRLVGVVSGDAVSLMQAGTFVSAQVGTGIAVTVHDSLGGANASDYTIIEPEGLTGSIVAATTAIPSTQQLVLAAQAEIESPVLAPGIGAEPQTLNASTTVQVQASAKGLGASDDTSDAGADSATRRAVVVNVSMNIGANGTLTIQSGGLRLPDNLSVETQ